MSNEARCVWLMWHAECSKCGTRGIRRVVSAAREGSGARDQTLQLRGAVLSPVLTFVRPPYAVHISVPLPVLQLGASSNPLYTAASALKKHRARAAAQSRDEESM